MPVRTAGPKALHAKKEARPSQLTGVDRIGLGTRRRRTQCSARLSYTPNGRGGGIRTRDLSMKDRRNPRLRSRPTRLSRCATTAEASMAARPRFERGPPGSEPGVVPVPPPRIASGREGSNLQPPAPEAGALPLRHVQVVLTAGVEPALTRPSTSCLCRLGYVSIGTDGRIRTDTGGGLGAVPLPVGLRQRGGPCGSRTRNLLLAGRRQRFDTRICPT